MFQPSQDSLALPQNSDARVSVVLVTWNAERHLERCVRALLCQTYRELSVIVIDNGSTDGTLAWLQRECPTVRVVQHRTNVGFSRAYNEGIAWSRGAEYVLCLNQDAYLSPTYVADLAAFLDLHFSTAAVSGKLVRFDPELGEPTTTIDSLGLAVRRTNRIYNIGEGTTDAQGSSEPAAVFGVSATAALYRRAALEDVALRHRGRVEYFDEDLFAYKEDVDLAWRLTLRGYESYVLPTVTAQHVRSVAKRGRGGRRARRPMVRALSYRNHLLVGMANQTLLNMVLMAPWMVTYELAKALYTFFVEPRTFWGGWRGILWLLPRTLRKRWHVQKMRKVTSKQIRRWLH